MRKLATIRRIEEVKPIEGADLIQAYNSDKSFKVISNDWLLKND